MEILIAILQATTVLGIGAVVFLVLRPSKQPPTVDPQKLTSDLAQLQTILSGAITSSSVELAKQSTVEVSNLRRELNMEIAQGMSSVKDGLVETLQKGRAEQSEALVRSTGALEERFAALQKSMVENLSTLGNATGQIVSVSKDVQSLHNILKSPHGRGAFGEMTLEFLLGNMLGNTGMYQRQYTLEGNEKVDTAVFVNCDRTRVISIDSKFPLANATPLLTGGLDTAARLSYRKAFDNDVLKRAEEVQSKYIKPPKTEDFAFMFVPSESVFWLVNENQALYEKMMSMKVYPVSPTTLLASLQIVLRNIQSDKVNRNATEIREHLEQIAQEFSKFEKDFGILGGHIENSITKYRETGKDVNKISLRLESLKKGEVGL